MGKQSSVKDGAIILDSQKVIYLVNIFQTKVCVTVEGGPQTVRVESDTHGRICLV